MGVDYEFLLIPKNESEFEDIWFGEVEGDNILTSVVADDVSEYSWNYTGVIAGRKYRSNNNLYFKKVPHGILILTSVRYGSKVNDAIISRVISEMRRFGKIHVGAEHDSLDECFPCRPKWLPGITEQPDLSLFDFLYGEYHNDAQG